MITELGYTAGWLDSSIHDFLKDMPRPFPSIRFALITCLDSGDDLPQAVERSESLRALKDELGINILGKGLLVPTKRLLDVERRQRLFFGFDEVWFFPKRPLEPKPNSVSLVGPDRIDLDALKEAVPWMERTSCTMGFGDGTGLNFTAKAHGLVHYLLAHSASQPAPSR